MGDSRSFILDRRGAGISDLSLEDLAAGAFDIDQADTAGVYHANSTHQVGIATQTEVGLSANRYPFRVVLLTAADLANYPVETAEACVSYWKVTNAAGLPIAFARKLLQNEVSLKNLYKAVPDFDDRIWVSYDDITARGVLNTPDAALDTRMNGLYDLLMVPNPTNEQWGLMTTETLGVIADCVRLQKYVSIKVAENAFIRGCPHGRAYGAVGNINANRAALIETMLCVKANYERLRARNGDVKTGVLVLSAYSIANMFRYGLQEVFEHKEYYTLMVTPSANNPLQFTVATIRSPVGAPAPAGYAVGSNIDLTGMKFNKVASELGSAMVMGSGLMHYMFNHTTGGQVVQGTLLTTLCMYGYMNKDMPQEEQIAITNVLYEALHPVNKRCIANLLFRNTGVTSHGRSSTAPMYVRFELDSFMTIRCSPYPAGSHKAVMALTAYKRVCQTKLNQFISWAADSTAMVTTCAEVLQGGARSHVGSAYYTGEPCRTQPAAIDKYLPDLAAYIRTFHKGDSLTHSPHMGLAVASQANGIWVGLLKSLKAADVSAVDIGVVRKYLSSAGASFYTFDPNDESTWATALQDSNTTMGLIEAAFA